jgi:dTDP-4-dehydrorhamnose reductase
MRIFLTGTEGQVGGALLPLLERLGTVVAPKLGEFDFSKPDTLTAILDRAMPNLIVNPAAYTAVDRAEDERELAFLINAKAPAVIARWAATYNVPMVHFSTDYVFDGSGTAPRREDSATGPLSVYGASKLAGDNAVKAAGGAHLIIRTSWVYAAEGANFLRTMARLAGERTELRVVADQIGAPTTAKAISDALIDILQAGMPNIGGLLAKRGGVVNVVCAGETSWHGFATAIVAGLKSRGVKLQAEKVIAITTSEFPAKAKRPANSRLDPTRLRDVFGVTMPSWQRALDHELDFLCAGVDERSQLSTK